MLRKVREEGGERTAVAQHSFRLLTAPPANPNPHLPAMLSLPRPTSSSSSTPTPRRPPSSHRSSRSPSPTLTLASASTLGPALSSPASSFAQLEPQPGYHQGRPGGGGWRAPVGVTRQSALVREKREVKSVERMSLDVRTFLLAVCLLPQLGLTSLHSLPQSLFLSRLFVMLKNTGIGIDRNSH